MEVKIEATPKKRFGAIKNPRVVKKNEAMLALFGIWKNKDINWRKDLNKSWRVWSKSY